MEAGWGEGSTTQWKGMEARSDVKIKRKKMIERAQSLRNWD